MKQIQAKDGEAFLLYSQNQNQTWGFQLAWWNIASIYTQKALSSLTDFGLFEPYSAQRVIQPQFSVNG